MTPLLIGVWASTFQYPYTVEPIESRYGPWMRFSLRAPSFGKSPELAQAVLTARFLDLEEERTA